MKASTLVLGWAFLWGIASAQSVQVDHTARSGASTPYDGYYNRSSQVTITGKVVGIGVSKPMSSMPNNVRYIVQTLTKRPASYLVEVGPQWFVNSQKTKPKLGQWIRVTGSRITDRGETKILAMQMELHNHSVLAMRRSTGVPYWVDLTPPVDAQATVPDDYTDEHTRLAAVGTILQARTFNINGMNYAGYVVQTENGPANVIVTPPNYSAPVASFNVGDGVRVFSSGYYPPVLVTGGSGPYIVSSAIFGGNGNVFVGPGSGFFPGYVPW
jgi:hypothetical protein